MAQTAQDIGLKLVSRTRILPARSRDGQPRTVPLSVVDNWTLKWSLTSAVWVLRSSLRSRTWSDYPRTILRNPRTIPSRDCQLVSAMGRTASLDAAQSEPQTAFWSPGYHVRLSRRSSKQRMSSRMWNGSSIPSEELLYPTSLALHNTDQCEGLPCVSVQLTTFACGGMSIGLRIMHPIADATAMFQFVKDWNVLHRALLLHQAIPAVAPIFDPSLVDGAAAGDIRGEVPDPTLVQISRSLPMHRYDCWASAVGCPARMLPLTAVPAGLKDTDVAPLGEPLPWLEWDMSGPVAHYLLCFTSEEIQRMREEAMSRQHSHDAPEVSHLDALLAHFWRVLVRARGMAHDRELINLAVILNLRSRLSPPLPEAFLGSPVVLARVSLTGEEMASPHQEGSGAAASTIPFVASAIRSATSCFNSDTIPALLHDMAHVVDPNRFWVAFYGRRHSVVNSWLDLGAYDVDFGSGAPPRYVDAIMPNVDGCVHVMEAGPASAAGETPEGGRGRGRWHDGPVCFSRTAKVVPWALPVAQPEASSFVHSLFAPPESVIVVHDRTSYCSLL
ncbi:hypothetical protein C8Q76DRAFT_120190 [Earliella scabrosa]|nr:hypothetical protein C8Q76DRAFT_120190 [Earliella scabrosa]